MAEWLTELPLEWATFVTFALFGILVIVCFRIPRATITAGARDSRRWRDLRLWAIALIVAQVGIYVVFS